ncbi:MAG: helix-turn-helix domain-containing protein [Desulfovibrio sp.]|nr:helix-turn-helix domain-containing protein [Desulfovibrio sp.]
MPALKFTEGWYTVKDTAKIMRVSTQTVRRLITSGRLRALNLSLGTKQPLWRIHEQWIADYAQSLPQEILEVPNNAGLSCSDY